MVDEARNPYNSRMDEILIEGRVFISSKQAAKITGYAKDYVGQLCREGRVDARLVGRNWYVLQDSIREHRFGKPEESVSDAPQAEPSVVEDRVSAWQRPQYQVETPTLVADLAPKSVTATPNPAIQDMQSAWREWFEEKRPASPVLPEETANPGDEPFSKAQTDMSVEEEVIEEEEVLITHISQDSVGDVPESEDDEESRVELHRSYGTRRAVGHMSSNPVPVADISSKSRRRSAAELPEEEGRSASGVVRAIIVVVALAAALVAIVGTGNADRLLAGTSFDFGAQKSIVEYLGGKSTYESSL